MRELTLAAYAIVWRLWRAAGWMVSLFPKSRNESIRAAKLRLEFSCLPPVDLGSCNDAGLQWAQNQLRLRQCVSKRDPRGFLTWSVIARAMFVPYASFTAMELSLLRAQPDWSRWRKAITEHISGCPLRYPAYPLTSANAIHHAYHLCRLELDAGAHIAAFRLICEFGGGYGSLCRIARGLGFQGDYIIFDLPELSALQRYYLASTSIAASTISDVETLRLSLERSEGPRLFVATWSLSESPAGLRRQIFDLVSEFDAFLFAYQDRFGHVDNNAFFARLIAGAPGIEWRTAPMPHLPGNTYLFGRRKKNEMAPPISQPTVTVEKV